jgi:hypothetical protein
MDVGELPGSASPAFFASFFLGGMPIRERSVLGSPERRRSSHLPASDHSKHVPKEHEGIIASKPLWSAFLGPGNVSIAVAPSTQEEVTTLRTDWS